MNRIQKINVNKGQSGFTLIEILVVVAIIAIIATVTMLSLQSAKRNVDDKQLIQDFNELRTGLEQYKTVCKIYPISLSATTNNSLAQVTNPGGGTSFGVANNNASGDACEKTFGEIMIHLDDIAISEYEYYPLARGTSPSYCSGYWLGVKLDETNGQLQNSQNVTWDKLTDYLTAQASTIGGWIPCVNGSSVPLINTTEQSLYFGQTSTGVCPNPSSTSCI